VTDAVKRALRNFGTLLGNCLYDKSYTQEITKIKVPPVRILTVPGMDYRLFNNSGKAKFDKSELYRRPEFDDTKPKITSTSDTTPASVRTAPQAPTITPQVKTNPVLVKSEAVQETETLITYIPRHLRQEMAVGAASAPSCNEQAPRSVHSTTNVLNTPIQAQAVNPNRGQYRRTEPSPLVQAEQRRVSFTVPAAVPTDEIEIPGADDTSYSIDSDDDAFYANVDLGDGDLGRPIHFEEGLGGVSVSDVSLDAATSGNLGESLKAPRGNSVHGRVSDASGRGEAAGSGGSRVSLANPSRPQAQAGPSTASRGLHGVDNVAGAPVPPQTKRESGSGSCVPTPPPSTRRAAPSMGGFHFPPGMVCALIPRYRLLLTISIESARTTTQTNGASSPSETVNWRCF
jgi:DNA repair and recombination protein RAD52